MRKRLTTIILIVIMFAGLSLLLYPTVSDYWNRLHQAKAMLVYDETVSNINSEEYERLWSEAIQYNQDLALAGIHWKLTDEETSRYEATLNVGASGMMGYIEIPKINCNLPIYHGTEESVLQIGVGHIAGSSLPVGGESTHCVLSGHRGLPRAKLFTDLPKLTEGDQFQIRTLNEVLTYEVDQIQEVLPFDLSNLQIVEGMDYCTLMTCTPYGINSHRLLVRGHRGEMSAAVEELHTEETSQTLELQTAGEAYQPSMVLTMLYAVVLVLFILVFILLIVTIKQNKAQSKETKATKLKRSK